MTSVLIWLHVLSVAGLALYGWLGFFTLWLFSRRRADRPVSPVLDGAELPRVTVQLPVYNEREVVGRLIAAVIALDYPSDRLDIQVLDDATDDTTALAAHSVAYYRAQGYDISLLHRDHREGYKAGALAAGLLESRGELIAIFDADFIPAPDFLRQIVPHFQTDPRLGLVQARWGHINAGASRLTGAQAIALDKHFVIEQAVRFDANYFPKFNGSAGVWRRDCIDDVGGWQIDTVCEDLCLSTRAALSGWRFHYAADVVAPAELPETMLAYKNQQARWAMGSTQCLRKYGCAILFDRSHALSGRLYALLSMSAYATHGLLLLLLLLQLPILLLGVRLPAWLLLCSILGLSQPVLFILAQRLTNRDLGHLHAFPTLLVVAVGLAPSNTWAVLKALAGRQLAFVRTPKGRGISYRLAADGILVAEGAFAVYAGVTLAAAVAHGSADSILFPFLCLLGFGYVALMGVLETRRTVVARRHTKSPVSTQIY